jgi:probable rRNA maturation factor
LITVQITHNFNTLDINLNRLENLVKAVCKRFGLLEATVGIAIVDNSRITKLNRQFLNRNCSTDCLSFDLSDKESSVRIFDLAVNAEKAMDEARARGHSNEAELALYITHGLLHNLGFDDSTARHKKKMHDTEDEILQQFGFGMVYNENTREKRDK